MTKAEIQLIRSLDDKRARDEAGLFVAEGEKLVRELLASDFQVRKIYSTKTESDLFSSEMLGFCTDRSREDRDRTSMYSPGLSDEKMRKTGVYYERVSAKEMERASRLKTPTGCLALVEIPRRTPSLLQGGLTLALDGVQNPGNLGTLIRLADWFGVRDIVCSTDSADCFNSKAVQATMGAITRVAVHYVDLEAILAAATVSVYGTFLEGENIYDAVLSVGGVIVMGSEGRGISPGIERLVTRKLFIPPFLSGRNTDGEIMGRTESLNVAVAAAIVCSEFRRRQ